jgi:peptide/nickel transport system permease protein
MMALAPGGPAAVLGPRGALSPEVMARINALYGLDKPWYVQYFYWLKQLLLHGSLGTSYVDQRPVIAKGLLERLPVTIEMVGLALLLTLIIAIPIGIYAGAHRGSFVR